jgi:hypothetical protein
LAQQAGAASQYLLWKKSARLEGVIEETIFKNVSVSLLISDWLPGAAIRCGFRFQIQNQ